MHFFISHNVTSEDPQCTVDRGGVGGHFLLDSDAFGLSPFTCHYLLVFVHAHHQADEILFLSLFSEIFSWMGVKYCQKCFCIIWDAIVFSLILLMWWLISIDFIMWNPSCNPGINSIYKWHLSFSYNTEFSVLASHWGLHIYSRRVLVNSFLSLKCLCQVLVSGLCWF